MSFIEPPLMEDKDLKALEELKKKHEEKLNALKRTIADKKRKKENKQVYTLGGIFRHFNWLWIEHDIAMGMIKDQIEKLESYGENRDEVIEHWRKLGKQERENAGQNLKA